MRGSNPTGNDISKEYKIEVETVTKDSTPKIAIVRANSELKIIASISDIL